MLDDLQKQDSSGTHQGAVTRPLSKRNFKEGPALPGEAGLRALQHHTDKWKDWLPRPVWASMPLSQKPGRQGSSHPWSSSGLGTEGSSCPGTAQSPPTYPLSWRGKGRTSRPVGGRQNPPNPQDPSNTPLASQWEEANLVYGPWRRSRTPWNDGSVNTAHISTFYLILAIFPIWGSLE